jgi:arginase family enzyme
MAILRARGPGFFRGETGRVSMIHFDAHADTGDIEFDRPQPDFRPSLPK